MVLTIVSLTRQGLKAELSEDGRSPKKWADDVVSPGLLLSGQAGALIW